MTALTTRGTDRFEAVQKFSKLMLAKLALYEHKGTWLKDSIDDLFRKLEEEVQELKVELWNLPTEQGSITNVGLEAADAANICMMLADLCGALEGLTSDHPYSPDQALVKEIERWKREAEWNDFRWRSNAGQFAREREKRQALELEVESLKAEVDALREETLRLNGLVHTRSPETQVSVYEEKRAEKTTKIAY